MTGPYESSALEYLRHGWPSPLPIVGKFPPPKGFTGADAPDPSSADVMSWVTGEEGNRNIGLRLPPHVIGIDVDHYDGKHGGDTLGDAEAVWGELPPTWIATSREDGVSGIRLYTVPPGLKWPGVVGPAVEVIQSRHRYAMVWPSIHPGTGQRYEWIMPEGDIASIHACLPYADDLPALPEKWVHGLTRGEVANDLGKIELPSAAAHQWLLGMSSFGDWCPVMHKATLRALADLAIGASRHDAAMRATARLVLLRSEGHPGLGDALGEVQRAFYAAVAKDKGRDTAGEWQRMIDGAVSIAAGRPPANLDPCKLMGGANYSPPRVAAPPSLAGSRPRGASAAAAAAPVLTVVPPDPAHEPQVAVEALAEPELAIDPAVALELHTQRARREAKRILDIEDQERGFTAPTYVRTLAEELAQPDEVVQFRVADVLPVGANVLLTAQYKSGKTTLVNHFVKCYADSRRFLGLLDVTPAEGRIAIFNYEVGAAQYRRWLRDLAIVNTDRVVLLNLRGEKLPLTSPAATRWVIDFLARNEVHSWVLDPWARAVVGSVTNENDNTEVGYVLDHLDYVKARAGVAELLIPAHTGRGEQEEGQERARGATRLDDWADVRWFLTKDGESGQRFFRATGRDVEFEEKSLEFEEATRELRIVGGSRKDARGERFKNAVRASIINTPDITKNGIEVAVRATLGKADDKMVRSAISELEEDGEIAVTRHGVGRANTHRLIRRSPFGTIS